MIRHLLVLGFAAASARGQLPARDSVSAPIRDVKYEVTFGKPNGERRAIDVSMTFSTAGNSAVLLSLPALLWWRRRERNVSPGVWVYGLALLMGFFRFLRGTQPVTWERLPH